MSGPIVRSGPSTKFTQNWSQVFGSKQAATQAKDKKSTKAKKKSAKKKT